MLKLVTVSPATPDGGGGGGGGSVGLGGGGGGGGLVGAITTGTGVFVAVGSGVSVDAGVFVGKGVAVAATVGKGVFVGKASITGGGRSPITVAVWISACSVATGEVGSAITAGRSARTKSRTTRTITPPNTTIKIRTKPMTTIVRFLLICQIPSHSLCHNLPKSSLENRS